MSGPRRWCSQTIAPQGRSSSLRRPLVLSGCRYAFGTVRRNGACNGAEKVEGPVASTNKSSGLRGLRSVEGPRRSIVGALAFSSIPFVPVRSCDLAGTSRCQRLARIAPSESRLVRCFSPKASASYARLRSFDSGRVADLHLTDPLVSTSTSPRHEAETSMRFVLRSPSLLIG